MPDTSKRVKRAPSCLAPQRRGAPTQSEAPSRLSSVGAKRRSLVSHCEAENGSLRRSVLPLVAAYKSRFYEKRVLNSIYTCI